MATWDLYKRQPSFVLGFHGCDKKVGEAVLAGDAELKSSGNEYDWLGGGVYFWEANPERALLFANEVTTQTLKRSKGKIRSPFVLGAVIDLGLCCNLLDSTALAELGAAYPLFVEAWGALHGRRKLPKNAGTDNGARRLDRAVVEFMHIVRKEKGLPSYDSVRAVFSEGDPLYPGSGFCAKAHIQIAVRNQDCIQGYFRPRNLLSDAT